MLTWIVSLAECLSIWIEKSRKMTDGAFILARTNLGANRRVLPKDLLLRLL